MAESLVIDPVSEDATNTALTLTDAANGMDVLEQAYPQPDRDRQFAASADTIGDPLVLSRYKDRTITLRIRCYGANMRARLRALEAKVGKLAQYGGTLQRTLADSSTVTYDVLDADVDVPADWWFVNQSSVTVTVTLLAKPHGRGATTSYSTATETTNPELVFTVAAPAGDVPALGLLEITEGQGVDQAFVQWGVEGRKYAGTAASAALAFSGASRLAYNGSTALAVSGALSGTVLNQGNLTTSYQAMCSLASSGTVYPSHVGTYSVWGRLYAGTANAGTVTCALEWSQADLLNYTRNDGTAIVPSRSGAFLHVNLGQVRLDKVLTGAQRWDGRLIAASTTAGDDLAVDRFYLFPVDDGYGEVRSVAVNAGAAPTSFVAADEFDQAAGNLGGKSLRVGGSWTTAGSTTDFAVEATGHTLQRSTTSDASPRFAVASGTGALGVSGARVDLSNRAGLTSRMGVVLRYTDTSNYCAVYGALEDNVWGTVVHIYVDVVVGGSVRTTYLPWSATVDGTLAAMVDTAGQVNVWWGASWVGRVTDTALATGGALATGKVGIYDYDPGASGGTRIYDNFLASATNTSDAAMFASKKLQVRDSTVIRQDSAGTAWAKPGDVRGSYLRVPNGSVGGTARFIVKASRTIPETGADTGIDDISATLTVTPLYLGAP